MRKADKVASFETMRASFLKKMDKFKGSKEEADALIADIDRRIADGKGE